MMQYKVLFVIRLWKKNIDFLAEKMIKAPLKFIDFRNHWEPDFEEISFFIWASVLV